MRNKASQEQNKPAPGPEGAFLDAIGTKILRRLLYAIQSPPPADFTPPIFPHRNNHQNCIKKEEKFKENHATPMFTEIYTKQLINKENSSLFMNSILQKNHNEVRNLKSEKSQDYSQKFQRNCTFMNSISVLSSERRIIETLQLQHFCHSPSSLLHGAHLPFDLKHFQSLLTEFQKWKNPPVFKIFPPNS